MSSSMVVGGARGAPAGAADARPAPADPTARAETGFHRLRIREDRCKGCELCVPACPTHVLALDRTRVNVLGYNPIHAVDPAACTSCALCAKVCPDAVFTVYAPPSYRGGTG